MSDWPTSRTIAGSTTPGGSVDCPGSAAKMLAAIQAFASGIPVQPVDPSLVLSKAVYLTDGVIASGGGRFDANVIARWTFKEGLGTTVVRHQWCRSGAQSDTLRRYQLGGRLGRGLRPQRWTRASLHRHQQQAVQSTDGQRLLFSRTVVVPANVTQKDAFIASYSGGTQLRNFTVAQTTFQYQAYARSSVTDTNGAPPLQTSATAQLAQAALQHVVLTYDPTNGRRLYINGTFTGDVDSQGGGSMANWDNTFAFLLGNETTGNRPWQGTVRFAAIHDAALTLAQIQQNYAAGVGALYDLLFDVSALSGMPQSYVMFQVSQYDSYSYLFSKPIFISLNPTAMPGSIPLQGMWLGINSQEVPVGQAYAPLSTTINNTNYSSTTGQLLSTVGTTIPLEKGPASDLFFLSFDRIGTQTHARTIPVPAATVPTDLPASPDIGLHVFSEINATMSSITGIPVANTAVSTTYQAVQEQLPAVPTFSSFLAANQIGIAQMAVSYCDALVNDPVQGPAFFPGLNLNQAPSSAFGTNAGMDLVITPLINSPAVGTSLATQPTDPQVRTELYNLMTILTQCSASDPTCTATPARTRTITTAACAAVLGSATTLIK